MSSSAALESTFAYALNYLFNLGIDKFELARIGQSTEHNYCGVKCGIMDQFASIFGKKGNLIRLDCKTMEYKYFPFNPVGYKLVLLDSVVKHELASSAYNRRRESCERATLAIRKNHPEVEFLRDAKREWLNEAKADINDEDYKRAEYVIGEVQRTGASLPRLSQSSADGLSEPGSQHFFPVFAVCHICRPPIALKEIGKLYTATVAI